MNRGRESVARCGRIGVTGVRRGCDVQFLIGSSRLVQIRAHRREGLARLRQDSEGHDTGRTATALVRLLKPNFILGVTGAQLFDGREAAFAYIRSPLPGSRHGSE